MRYKAARCAAGIARRHVGNDFFCHLRSPESDMKLLSAAGHDRRRDNWRRGWDTQSLFQAPVRATLVTRRDYRCVNPHLALSPPRRRTEKQARLASKCTHARVHNHTIRMAMRVRGGEDALSRHHWDATPMAFFSYIAAITKLELRSRSFPERDEGINRFHPVMSVPTAPIMTGNVYSHRSHQTGHR